jgi:anionic cell wall polymer biosynthesis LytR-Cps2A-Psr (LCP) family protein
MQISRISALYNRVRRRFFSHPGLARIIILIFLLVFVLVGWVAIRHPVSRIFGNLQLIAGKPLVQNSGRTNIVILGTGGDGHEGPDLADTIIFVSIKLDTGKTTLISIPRDLWVPSLRAKINTAYHYGFEKQATAGGLLLAKSAVSESLEQPVHYAIKVDFSVFVRAIDLMGGLDVNVDRGFTDRMYPIPGKESDPCDGDPETKCRYEVISFASGPQHMDGQTALKFVRSRHSDDSQEGTDFARSKRQEKIISAIRSKLLSVKNLKNSEIYKALYRLIRESVITDITSEYYSTFFQLGLKMRHSPFSSYSVEEYLENPEISDKYDLQWVLIPKNNDPKSVTDYVSSLLN